MGILALAGLARNSRCLLRSSTIRWSNFYKRPGASRFREICFSCAAEDVVIESGGGRCNADVRFWFNGVCDPALQRRRTSYRGTCEGRARAGIVDVRVPNDLIL